MKKTIICTILVILGVSQVMAQQLFIEATLNDASILYLTNGPGGNYNGKPYIGDVDISPFGYAFGRDGNFQSNSITLTIPDPESYIRSILKDTSKTGQGRTFDGIPFVIKDNAGNQLKKAWGGTTTLKFKTVTLILDERYGELRFEFLSTINRSKYPDCVADARGQTVPKFSNLVEEDLGAIKAWRVDYDATSGYRYLVTDLAGTEVVIQKVFRPNGAEILGASYTFSTVVIDGESHAFLDTAVGTFDYLYVSASFADTLDPTNQFFMIKTLINKSFTNFTSTLASITSIQTYLNSLGFSQAGDYSYLVSEGETKRFTQIAADFNLTFGTNTYIDETGEIHFIKLDRADIASNVAAAFDSSRISNDSIEFFNDRELWQNVVVANFYYSVSESHWLRRKRFRYPQTRGEGRRKKANPPDLRYSATDRSAFMAAKERLILYSYGARFVKFQTDDLLSSDYTLRPGAIIQVQHEVDGYQDGQFHYYEVWQANFDALNQHLNIIALDIDRLTGLDHNRYFWVYPDRHNSQQYDDWSPSFTNRLDTRAGTPQWKDNVIFQGENMAKIKSGDYFKYNWASIWEIADNSNAAWIINVNHDATGSTEQYVYIKQDANNFIRFRKQVGDTVRFNVRVAGVDVVDLVSTSTLSASTTYQIAVVRNGANWGLFIDGTQEAFVSNATLYEIGASFVWLFVLDDTSAQFVGRTQLPVVWWGSNLGLTPNVGLTESYTVPTDYLTDEKLIL
jgi:hypothetical protein